VCVGVAFEARILASEKNNVKFNFLLAADPYHAFYRLRVTSPAPRQLPCLRTRQNACFSCQATSVPGLSAPQIKEFSEEGEGGAAKDGTAAPAPAAAAAARVPAPAIVLPQPPKATVKPLEKPEDEHYTVGPGGPNPQRAPQQPLAST
jgi:splicing factor 3A subunit 1